MIKDESDLSQLLKHPDSPDTLFRHYQANALIGPASPMHSAMPCDLQSACRIFCDSHNLCATLAGLDSEGHGAGVPYEAAITRRLTAWRVLIEHPATTVSLVIAKASVVAGCSTLASDETEVGLLAVELVRELAEVGPERPRHAQGRALSDGVVARIFRAFFDADRVYEEAVNSRLRDQTAITRAAHHRAEAMALVRSFPASVMAEVIAKATVILHYSRWALHDATDLGLLALVVLRELTSIAGAQDV